MSDPTPRAVRVLKKDGHVTIYECGNWYLSGTVLIIWDTTGNIRLAEFPREIITGVVLEPHSESKEGTEFPL